MIQIGWTALMHASQYGHLPVVEYLVQKGADINIQNKVRNDINYLLFVICSLCYIPFYGILYIER